MLVSLCSALRGNVHVDALLWVWLGAIICGTAYNFVWDITMDWGLMRRNAAKPLLRDILLFRSVWVYYAAICCDLVLRLMWTLTISPESASFLGMPKEAMVTVLAACERGLDTDERLRAQQLAEGALLPAAFLVPETGRTPVKSPMPVTNPLVQSSKDDWIFSTLAALEASYRKTGVDKGFLDKSQYLPFSEWAYKYGYGEYCKSVNDNDTHCPALSERDYYITPDGRPEWLYYVKYLQRYVLPDAVCPDAAHGCPAERTVRENNPLQFAIRGVQTAHTISGIKRLLYEKQVGLVWSNSALYVTYEIPCQEKMRKRATTDEPDEDEDEDEGRHEVDECKLCLNPCNFGSGCCEVVVQSGINKQGVYMVHKTPFGDRVHDAQVVGWNDEFRVQTGRPGTDEYLQGGFIIKNSLGNTYGHSAGYWAGQTSIANENMICPAEESALTWVPADLECMMKSRNPAVCAFDSRTPEKPLKKLVRGHWVQGATVLKCTNCGYYFYPYETFIQATINYQPTGIVTPVVMHFDVDWKDSSYVFGSRSRWPQYRLLNQSLKSFTEVKFDGPWDWNANIKG
eukprot:m51a1_g4685 hypothetical protein (570) ;mRNA; r:176070-180377